MSNLQRRIYGAVIRLHPAAFRDEFGREMVLDFEEAVRDRGFAVMLSDAFLSLARQWTVCALPEREAEQPASGHPFLAGQYVMIGQGSLSVFDLARASVLAFLFFAAIGFAFNIANKRAIANLQTVHASHDGGMSGANNNPPRDAEDEGRREAGGARVLLTTPADAHYRAMVHLGRRAAPPGWGTRASGGPPPTRPLANALRQLAMISIIIWLTSFLLRRSPGIVRRVVLVALGLLGIAASVAYGSVHMPSIHGQVLHASGPLPSFEAAPPPSPLPPLR